MRWLDLIFPRTCVGCGRWGSYLCEECWKQTQFLENQFCPVCSRPALRGKTHPKCQRPLGLDGLLSLTYFSFPINKVIYALKYRFTTDLLKELSTKIDLPRQILLSIDNALLLPVPLHWQRQNYRGFNQAEALGVLFSEKWGLRMDSKFLIRVAETKPQASLGRSQRLANVRSVFRVTGDVRNRKFVLFDDVWTTGATLRSAGYTLKRAGASQVWGLTLARSH